MLIINLKHKNDITQIQSGCQKRKANSERHNIDSHDTGNSTQTMSMFFKPIHKASIDQIAQVCISCRMLMSGQMMTLSYFHC